MQLASVVSAALLSSMAAIGASSESGPVTPFSELSVPATQVVSLETRAKGVQIYDCKAATADPSRLEWVFRSPEADLYDTAGKRIGKHYAGPTWESNDGSKVVGKTVTQVAAPDANAIPWLLLVATSTSGYGILGRTESVQRVLTVGGKAPATGCDQPGQEARVPYEATYYFYSGTITTTKYDW